MSCCQIPQTRGTFPSIGTFYHPRDTKYQGMVVEADRLRDLAMPRLESLPAEAVELPPRQQQRSWQWWPADGEDWADYLFESGEEA